MTRVRRTLDRRLWIAKVESPEARIDGERRGSGDCSGSSRVRLFPARELFSGGHFAVLMDLVISLIRY